MGYKCVILGGGGSFGINTAFYLLNHGNFEKVIGIGRNPLRSEPFSLNINEKPSYEYHTFHLTYELDLLLDFLDKEKPDYIVNYAAQGEGAVSWDHSWRFFETNSMGLARLYEELMKRDYVKNFIQIGTSEMYGSVHKAAKEDDPIKPSSPYAASKVAFDMYLMSMHKFKNTPMTILRPSNAYCSGQLLHRIIPKTIVSGLLGKKIPLHGGGKSMKSYIHIYDLAQAILRVIKSDNAMGKVYNVGPEFPISIFDLVNECAEVINVPFDKLVEEVPDRLGQDSIYWLDSSAIKKDLMWKETISLHEGLESVAFWAKNYLDELAKYPMDYTLRG